MKLCLHCSFKFFHIAMTPVVRCEVPIGLSCLSRVLMLFACTQPGHCARAACVQPRAAKQLFATFIFFLHFFLQFQCSSLRLAFGPI
eukprot:COSAG04_NODE_16776_length_489_cov_1.012821_2_plen_86_part_01